MRRVVVREHERIPVRPYPVVDAERAISQGELDALLRVCELQNIKAFEPGFRSVKFTQFCGVIQAGGVSIEILPKVANDDGYDRGVLLRMLAVAGDFPLSRLDGQKLALQSHSLIAALVRWFCAELFEQCHRGLLRAYVEQQEDLAVIRGRWRPDLDLQRFPGRKDRLSCEFDELTADNAYNRILKAALRKVRALALGPEVVQRDIEILLSWFADVSDVEACASDVRKLPQNRLVARYSRALMMAEWFLDDSAPDLRKGRANALALVFDMNALFQSVLGRFLRRALPDGYQLREEAPRYFLTCGADGRPHFQMKPDLCLLKDGRVVAIIDAKWKRLDPDGLGGKWGISQADVYQLRAYAHAYGCSRVALWYPAHSGLPAGVARPVFDFLLEGDGQTGEQLQVDWIAIDALDSASTWYTFVQSSVSDAFARLVPPVPEVSQDTAHS